MTEPRPGAMSPKAGLYVHIPFCLGKCPYCDFYSITDLSLMQDFCDGLAAEMCMQQNGEFGKTGFDSVYIGGGTPTVMDAARIADILECACETFAVGPDAEITIEANPATIREDQLELLRRAGVNRINLGLQSFDDANLAFLGRLHTADDGWEALRIAEKSGFENIGIDLIYALPGQAPGNWQKELDRALFFNPAHISCYMLTLEPDTPMGKAEKTGTLVPAGEDMQREMFLMTAETLTGHGYDHYEISNFARSVRKRSLHNTGYWNNRPYLGLGPGAHSYAPPVRRANVFSVRRYLERVKAGRSPLEEAETLDVSQQMMEAIYLGLRQADGIRADDFNRRFQADFFSMFSDVIQTFVQNGCLKADHTGVRPALRGMLLQDSIAAAFIGRL